MADNCIFCGKALNLFSGCTLSCGGADQPACSECAERYGRESMLQRARLALDTGRAREPEKLTAYVDQEERRQREQAEWQEKASRCPACGGEMELKLKNFSIGADGNGGLLTLLTDTYDVDLYACPVCGKVELYTAGFFRKAKEEEEQITCPVCGTRHGASMGCPTCAVRAAQSGRMPQPAGQPPREEPAPFKPSRSRFGKKPPWEK